MRQAGFGDVHSSKNFDTGRQRILNLLRHQQALVQEPVFPGTDPENPLFRLDVDVTHPVGNGVKEEFVHQSNHRGVRLRSGGEGGRIHRENFIHRLFQQACLNVVAVNCFPHIPFGRGDKKDRTAQVLLDRIPVGDVQCIPESHHHRTVVLHTQRQGKMAQG